MNFHAKNLDFEPKSNLQNLEEVNFDHFLEKIRNSPIFWHFKLIIFGQIVLKKFRKSLIFFLEKNWGSEQCESYSLKKIETESFFESKNKMQRSHFLKGGEKTRRTLTSIKWHERKAKVVLLFSRSSKAAHDFGLNEIGTCQSHKSLWPLNPN